VAGRPGDCKARANPNRAQYRHGAICYGQGKLPVMRPGSADPLPTLAFAGLMEDRLRVAKMMSDRRPWQ